LLIGSRGVFFCPQVYANCLANDIVPQDDFWSMSDPGVGRQLAIMAGCGLIYFLIVLWIEFETGLQIRPRVKPLDPSKVFCVCVGHYGKPYSHLYLVG
jgi:hypothetical protein